MTAVDRLRAAIRADGTPLAAALDAAPDADGALDGPDPAVVAAAGPRADGRREEVELAVGAVLEGSLLHYGEPRAVAIDDPDLALLAGDRLYALGLDRLAELGDLDAIAELADVIALNAQAHAAGDEPLALAAWQAGAAAIGHGATPALDAAKQRARAGDPAAAAALRAAAALPEH